MIKYTEIGGEIKRGVLALEASVFWTKITTITFLKESVFMGKPRLTHTKNKYKKSINSIKERNFRVILLFLISSSEQESFHNQKKY
jgi:hypothetical protein